MNAQIVHSIPGRLRIKIPAARDQIPFFADLERKLLAAEGVLDVRVNPAAASVVIMYDDSVDPLAVCRDLPGWAVRSSAVRPRERRIVLADNAGGGDTEFVFLLAKLLPLIFAKHPVAQLAEVLGEPILRAVVDAVTRPQPYRLPEAAKDGEDLIAIAA
ncbi:MULTISPECIES: HMA2 domain-containing protein [unclassified Sinorhizobium]|uniref:HMA2 domain-containing protein n=1 Tax=unclassified Sinorhizobium TaxID=2613772 RepID=UPI003524589A